MTFNKYDIILKKIINLTQKNMPVATIVEEKIADRLIEISKTNYKKFYRISEMLIRRIARRENRLREKEDKLRNLILEKAGVFNKHENYKKTN